LGGFYFVYASCFKYPTKSGIFLEPIIKILDAQKAKKSERAVYGLLHPNVPIMNSWMRSRGLWVGKASWPYKNWPTYISGPCTFMDKEAALGNELNFNLK